MSLVEDFKGSGTTFARIGEGSFPARIAQILDIGTQEDTYEGVTKQVQKLWITFELPTETIEIDGQEKPRWLSSEFTKSTSDKSRLIKVINATMPDAEEFTDLLGKPCLVEIGTTSGGKDKWTGSMKLPKGMGVAELANPPVYFDILDPDQAIFDKLPDFLKDKIVANLEFNGSAMQAALGESANDAEEEAEDLDDIAF